eukprot:4042759-Amphidinium_carterae.1
MDEVAPTQSWQCAKKLQRKLVGCSFEGARLRTKRLNIELTSLSVSQLCQLPPSRHTMWPINQAA